MGEADCVVELGPGTGALTRRIVPQLKQNAVFLCIDSNPVMVKFLKKEIDRGKIIHDGAEQLKKYIDEAGIPADVIFSSLPFSTLPRAKSEKILEAIQRSLGPKGKLILYQYMHAAWHTKARLLVAALKAHFREVKMKKVFGNIPPAFVFTCLKST